MGEAGATPPVTAIAGYEITSAERQRGRHFGGADATRIGAGRSKQVVAESIADCGEEPASSRGLQEMGGCHNEERIPVFPANSRKGFDDRARPWKSFRVGRTANFESATPGEPEFFFGPFRLDNPHLCEMPPPSLSPPFDDDQLHANRGFSVGDQTLQLKRLVGLAEASAADHGETGEKPQLAACSIPPVKGGDCCRQTDDEK
jgi:hypothetical protein